MSISLGYKFSFVGFRSDARDAWGSLHSNIRQVKREINPITILASNGGETYVSIHIHRLNMCAVTHSRCDGYDGYGMVDFEVLATFHGPYEKGVVKRLDRVPVVILRHTNRYLKAIQQYRKSAQGVSTYFSYKAGAQSDLLKAELRNYAVRLVEDEYIAWVCRPDDGIWFKRALQSFIGVGEPVT